jgi:prepilin-type N-terminal cleavage/methylation domain-containing protein/prepilin-type processing-associated H-X9-DG protein
MQPFAKRAFTLIELLVVIAIIAILAAILFPVFAQARAKARGITCISNVKNIALAGMMYTQDYDENLVFWYLPTNLPNNEWAAWKIDWVEATEPYVKNGAPIDPPAGYSSAPRHDITALGIFKCPSWSVADYQAGAETNGCWGVGFNVNWVPGWYHANYGVGYGGDPYGGCTPVNPYYHVAGSGFHNDGSVAPMTLSAVGRPAETAEVSDGVSVVWGGGFWMTMGCEAEKIHGDGGNFGMIDGHAKWITRNAERYEDTDATGCVYTRFFSVDKP